MPLGTKSKTGSPALQYFEVRFAEIEALYDLSPGDALVSAERDDRVPAKLFAYPGLLGTAEYLDLQGTVVHAPSRIAEPTLFVEVRGGATVRRTFVRSRSTPIDKKWVYVFRGAEPDGRDATLASELYFERGRFRRAKPADGAGDPPGGSGGEEALFLERGSAIRREEKPHRYFFHLATHRLARPSLEALAKEIRSRAVSLDDPFHVDIHPTGDPKSGASILTWVALGKPIPEPEKRGYRVHLFDALKEGLRRAHQYQDALESYEAAQKALAADPEYVLAKRIQVVTERTNLRDLVSRGLFDYLGPAERDSARRFFAAHVAAADLLTWIGEEQRRGTWWNGSKAIQAYHDAGDRTAAASLRGDEQWGNAFSRAMRDAYDNSTSASWETFWASVAVVHHRLNELAGGREWLRRNLDRSLDQNDPIADAGAAQVFQAKRKLEQAIPAGLGWLLEQYGKAWTRRYREVALRSLQEWIASRYGVEAIPQNRAERRAFESAERRELRRARRKGVNALELEPPKKQNVEFAKGAFEALSLGIEAVNIAAAVQSLREDSGNPWNWVDATGAVLDGYEALGKVAKGVPAIEVKLTGRLVALKAVYPLAAIAGAIDVAGGVRGAARAGEGGERFGYGMATAGATLALAGALAVTGPVALGIIAIGIALQAAGQGLAGQFGPLQRLLRNGRFGDGGGVLAKAADFLDPEVDEHWYRGKKLSALKADISGQLRALDEILYGFEVEVTNAGSRLSLAIELSVPGQLTADATWNVSATVAKDGSPQPLRLDDAAVLGAPAEKAKKLVHLLDVDPPSFRSPQSRYTPIRNVSIAGTVTLDVRGDGKTIIARSFERVIDLWREQSFGLG